uniref:Uncharacterized protein n=1 Tax=Heterosigma akashiwo TaxID=2829 RepID=A0A7S3XI57_HETAK
MKVLSAADEASLLQAGTQGATAFVQQIATQDNENSGGFDENSALFFQQLTEHVKRVLEPEMDDSLGMFAPDLALHLLLLHTNQEATGSLLAALLNKLAYAQSEALSGQLVLALVRLVAVDAEAVTSFLLTSSLPPPLNRDGMELFLAQWLRFHSETKSTYLAKVSCAGMLSLLSCCIHNLALCSTSVRADLMLRGPARGNEATRTGAPPRHRWLARLENRTLVAAVALCLARAVASGGNEVEDEDEEEGEASGPVLFYRATTEEFLFEDKNAESDPMGAIDLKGAMESLFLCSVKEEESVEVSTTALENLLTCSGMGAIEQQEIRNTVLASLE